jgi:hypothetical protein
MDPIGFTLENFDAVGAWRARDAGEPIDASGQFVDGTNVDGVVTLRHALLKRPDVFVRTMTQKMLTYALGRGVEDYDMPAVRAIVHDSSSRTTAFVARARDRPQRAVSDANEGQRKPQSSWHRRNGRENICGS